MDTREAIDAPTEVPPIAERGKDVEDTCKTMQAGRSDSSLNAEQNAADIRARRSLPSSSPSNVNTPASQSATIQPENSTTPPGSILGRRASYAPRTPFPLNPSSSSSSINSNGSSAVSDEKQIEQSPSKPRDGGAFSKRSNRPSSSLTPMQELLRQKSMPNLRPERSEHLKDLERRYSRYPAMGLDSRKQSSYNTRPTQVSSTTHLLDSCTSTASFPAANPSSETTLAGENEKWSMVDDMSSFNPYSGGEKGFILYANELEDDDDDHMPKDDDDFVFKLKVSDYFNRRVIVSTIGGIFFILGILSLFIVLPVIYFTGIVRMQFPGVDWNYWPDNSPPDTWATVNHRNYSLLSNVRRGLIDPDTPESAMIRKSTFDGADLNLVFSDEFNRNNRTFYPGDDPYWSAPNIWYGATQDMEWYDPDAVTTYDGTLQLRLDQFPNHNLNYRSGMLNSWNQLCFKGGVFEVSVSLPGPAGVPGLWPGVWSMGNLGRPGYKATTEG
jgi:beta-glucan synthesis-associated protein KRE6